ncbi:uncharacterized protein M421DRAFT_415590 [Didymella exigua CBS 183.55]|uniref:Uncharacterized protein n=1 Tax=Didymella exigua CBS 183.55 TaxID=1150837 RepID=A0A6A5S1S4_9PLEO|nr:uncharacterized protein M421DRAFT_415590 [Didymella exigua CBS 183.55]KAF1933238.1 hypothetical protein M421DRAFT_415590 [Didymella exigua CBS 183.55]
MEQRNPHNAIAHQKWEPANLGRVDVSLSLQEQSALSRYSSLPWELRNHIHTFYVQGFCDNEVIVRRGTERGLNLLVRQTAGPHSYHWVKDPILQQSGPNRIGVAAARELLEAYYRNRAFKFIHDELSTLRPFLEADTFGLAMRPADYVRRLQLQIQPFKYAQLRELNAMDQEEHICRGALESLIILHSPHTAIEIRADLAQGFCDDEEYDELLDDAAGFIFRTVDLVDSLKKKGLKVEVTFDGRWDGRDGARIGTLSSLNDCVFAMKVACQ